MRNFVLKAAFLMLFLTLGFSLFGHNTRGFGNNGFMLCEKVLTFALLTNSVSVVFCCLTPRK